MNLRETGDKPYEIVFLLQKSKSGATQKSAEPSPCRTWRRLDLGLPGGKTYEYACETIPKKPEENTQLRKIHQKHRGSTSAEPNPRGSKNNFGLGQKAVPPEDLFGLSWIYMIYGIHRTTIDKAMIWTLLIWAQTWVPNKKWMVHDQSTCPPASLKFGSIALPLVYIP